jgi:hypothetical protein
MSTLQRADTSVAPDADTSVAPEASGRHLISPLLLVVLIAAVLWVATLRVRRRRAKRLGAGDGDGMQNR